MNGMTIPYIFRPTLSDMILQRHCKICRNHTSISNVSWRPDPVLSQRLASVSSRHVWSQLSSKRTTTVISTLRTCPSMTPRCATWKKQKKLKTEEKVNQNRNVNARMVAWNTSLNQTHVCGSCIVQSLLQNFHPGPWAIKWPLWIWSRLPPWSLCRKSNGPGPANAHRNIDAWDSKPCHEKKLCLIILDLWKIIQHPGFHGNFNSR